MEIKNLLLSLKIFDGECQSVFEEVTPGTFVRIKDFHIQTNCWADKLFNQTAKFCYNIRDGIANLIDGQMKVLVKICATKNLLICHGE